MSRKPVSNETRAKMSAAKLGKLRGPHTEATKLKMSAAHKGKLRAKAPEQATFESTVE